MKFEEIESEYHSKELLEIIATIRFIDAIEIVRENWANCGNVKVEYIRDFAFGKGFRFSFVTGGWSGNEDLINALLSNEQSFYFYEKWERGGLHVFFISPSFYGYRTQAEMARAKNVSRQRISENKGTYEQFEFHGKKYIK